MKLIHVSTGQELEDSRSLSDLKVQNDDVFGLCFKKETSAGMYGMVQHERSVVRSSFAWQFDMQMGKTFGKN
jgi:hypothetical protein